MSSRKRPPTYDLVARGFVIAGVILEVIGGTKHSINAVLLVGAGLILVALAIFIVGRTTDKSRMTDKKSTQASSVSDWYRSRRGKLPER